MSVNDSEKVLDFIKSGGPTWTEASTVFERCGSAAWRAVLDDKQYDLPAAAERPLTPPNLSDGS